MCIFNTRWFLSYFWKKEELSQEEIQIKRIKLLPFVWKLDKNHKLI